MEGEAVALVAERLQAFPPGSPEHQLGEGLAHWLSANDTPLETCLGLQGAVGTETARTRWKRSQRNIHIRQALAELDGSPWQRCRQLAKEVRRFEVTLWPRWRDLDQPPPGASRLRAALYHARKLGPLPASATQLAAIQHAE